MKSKSAIFILFLVFASIISCKEDEVVVSVATVTALNCSSATVSATATNGASYTGTITVPYTGGNAVAYSAATVTSTGVSGLTGTIAAGTLASGAGSVVLTVTGTPTSTGTATFPITLGGQSCSATLTVQASKASITGLTCTAAPATGTNGTAYTGTVSMAYTGGNGGTYDASTASSTGVTGLTATVAAGTLASGAGTLTYNITGTPTSVGTASFALSLGGQSCTVAVTVAASTGGTGSTTVTSLITAIDAFKATLTATQISTLQIALTKANAIKWSNLPGGVKIRNGIEFSTLTATQLEAALKVIKLVSGSTANEGYDEFNQVRLADTYLATKGNGYSEGLYIIAILGTPSATGSWILQFGGHHYAQNISINGGKVISNTPSHQGVEPLTWTSGSTTYAPMKDDHAAMLAMLTSLTAAQLTTAKLSATFSDVLLGPNKDGQFPATKLGLKVSTLTTAQKALVLAAIKPWVNDADDETAASLLKIYEVELDETYISYSGNATLAANADYVRIDGPSAWVELVCQSGVVFTGVHYHAIFRDHTRDYNGL